MLEQEIQELTKVYRQILNLLLQNNLSQTKPIQQIEVPQHATKQIKISDLKQFALANLPATSSLRDLILAEKEELSVQEFLAKLDLWLRLFNKEFS
jgi:predicted XRE-type DNA-binding protein